MDSRDRVYAATSPDGKIYRITGNGKPEVFYDPKAKYIWALAFDAAGNLFVATGDQGELHRVTPDGKGAVFFKTDETHIRSLAMDAKGNLILGTEPGGLVLRVSPGGRGIRAVPDAEAGSDGGGAGSRRGDLCGCGGEPAGHAARRRRRLRRRQLPGAGARATVTVGAGAAARQPAAVPPPSTAPAGVAGGSEVYRIDADGAPRRVWGHAQDVVYAIAFDATGRALLGAGNKGNIYRIESPTLYTSLLALPATQVTAFQAGRGRTSVRGHGEYGQGVRDWSRVGARGLDRERRVRFRHVLAVGAAELRGEVERRAGGDGDAQRQSGPAAEELERVGRGAGRRKGGRSGLSGGAFRAVEGDADGRIAGTGFGGRGVSAEEPGAAHRRDRGHAGELPVPAGVDVR